MTHDNFMSRKFSRLTRLPPRLRYYLLTLMFGSAVRFVRTAGIQFLELSQERAVLVIPNRQHVRNHIGTIHASAMALLAETATGAVLGMNVPDDQVPVLKSMYVNYLKRAKGTLRAEASLSMDARRSILSNEKGDVLVPVLVTDETGAIPIECEIWWACRPKKRI